MRIRTRIIIGTVVPMLVVLIAGDVALLVASGQDRAFGSAVTDRLGPVGAILVIALVAGGTGFVTAGWITRPIQRLRTLAAALAAGDLDRRVGFDRPMGGELGQLADALDDMADQLGQRIDNLVAAQERRFDQLMASTPDVVLIVDDHAVIVDANARATDVTGLPLDQLVGRSLSDVLDADPVLAGLRDDAGGHRAGLSVARSADGRHTPVEVTISPIEMEHGRQFVVNLRDVTDRLEVEERLRASERYHRMVFEVADVGIMETDLRDGARILRANEAMSRMLGCEPSELIGRTPDEFTHPDDVDGTLALVEQATQGHVARIAVDGRYMHRDGHAVWVRLNAAILTDDAGAPDRAIAVVTDVSARRRSDALIRGVFDNSPDAYLVVVDGVVVDTNNAACALLERSREAIVGSAPVEVFAGSTDADRARAFDDHFRAALDGGDPVAFDWTFDHGERRVPAGVVIAPIATTDERDVALVLARDMTGARLFEQHLIAARDAARAADRAKSEFLATMSHEVRTPMNGVVGTLELLASSPLSGEQRQLVATSTRSAKDLLAILNDILDFSKIEAGRLDLEAVPVSVMDLVDDVGQVFGVKARENGNRLVLTADHSVPEWVAADPVRLRQVLSNLVSNAVKFTRDGRVWINVGAEAGRLRLTVADDGIGMTDEQVDVLFTPFRQAEQSTARRFGGTGLGLTIVGRLVDLMDGRIEVASTAGRGTRFDVFLPLPACDAPADAPEPIDLRGVTVAVLMGHPDLDGAAQNHLGAAGADVRLMGTLDELLQVCRSGVAADRVDAVLLGDAVGDGDRRRTVTALRQDPASQHVSVVVTRREGLDVADPSGAFVLDAAPLRRRAVQLAVAVVTGRASPEPIQPVCQVDLPEPVGLPPIEDAESAGNLVLVVDDHPVNRDVLVRQVRLLGYVAEAAADGEQALGMMSRRRYGVVLSDVHMPRVDGYELCRRIRASSGDGPRVPVVAVTANAMRGEEERALEAGMDGYLTKPTDLRTLRATLHRWLGPPPASEAPTEPPDDVASVLDVQVLGHMFAGDDDAVVELLRGYASTQNAHVADLVTAARGADDAHLEACAHRLGSAAAMVGAQEVSDLAKAVEGHVRAGRGATARAVVAEIEPAAQRLLRAIDEVESVDGKPTGPAPNVAEPTNVVASRR